MIVVQESARYTGIVHHDDLHDRRYRSLFTQRSARPVFAICLRDLPTRSASPTSLRNLPLRSASSMAFATSLRNRISRGRASRPTPAIGSGPRNREALASILALGLVRTPRASLLVPANTGCPQPRDEREVVHISPICPCRARLRRASLRERRVDHPVTPPERIRHAAHQYHRRHRDHGSDRPGLRSRRASHAPRRHTPGSYATVSGVTGRCWLVDGRVAGHVASHVPADVPNSVTSRVDRADSRGPFPIRVSVGGPDA